MRATTLAYARPEWEHVEHRPRLCAPLCAQHAIVQRDVQILCMRDELGLPSTRVLAMAPNMAPNMAPCPAEEPAREQHRVVRHARLLMVMRLPIRGAVVNERRRERGRGRLMTAAPLLLPRRPAG